MLKKYKATVTYITKSTTEYAGIYAQNKEDAEEIARNKFRESYNFVCQMQECEVTEES